jgi:hypothetical protein
MIRKRDHAPDPVTRCLLAYGERCDRPLVQSSPSGHLHKAAPDREVRYTPREKPEELIRRYPGLMRCARVSSERVREPVRAPGKRLPCKGSRGPSTTEGGEAA